MVAAVCVSGVSVACHGDVDICCEALLSQGEMKGTGEWLFRLPGNLFVLLVLWKVLLGTASVLDVIVESVW
jgi:hypothetical protein